MALRVFLVLSSAELGNFADGLTWSREVRALADASNHPADLVWGHYGVGRLLVVRGEFAEAIPILEGVFHLSETGELPVYRPRIAAALGTAYLLAGRTLEAISILEEGVQRGETLQFRFNHSLVVTALAEAYMRAGRLQDALREALHGLELARAYRERGFEAYALRALGEASSLQDASAGGQAEGYSSQALEVAESLQMRPLAARCRLGLGALHRTQDAGPWREEIAAARDEFHALGMPLWERLAEHALSGQSHR